MKYAAPCVGDLVALNLITEEYANEILEATGREEVLPNSEIQFNLAHLMCEHVALRLSKNKIDEGVIRIYYINLHNNLLKIHKPITCGVEECKIKIVKEVDGLDTSFFRKIDKPNIVTHRGYVVDLLTDEELEVILSKSSYLATH